MAFTRQKQRSSARRAQRRDALTMNPTCGPTPNDLVVFNGHHFPVLAADIEAFSVGGKVGRFIQSKPFTQRLQRSLSVPTNEAPHAAEAEKAIVGHQPCSDASIDLNRSRHRPVVFNSDQTFQVISNEQPLVKKLKAGHRVLVVQHAGQFQLARA